jgi:serine phosphatase RsbU (regulator of sigma subunit)/pSer/pThr/pTyr-binding forkhead associated (FHA) protein
VISDFRVSRVHAKLVSENDEYLVLDAGSRHGTFLNGRRCERAAVKNHDEITLGVPGLKLIFLEGEQAGAATRIFNRIVTESDRSDLEKLRLFLEAARSLGSGAVVADVLRNMLDYALRLTRAERGFIYLKHEGGAAALSCGLDRHGNQLDDDANVSHSVVEEAMASAAEFIAADATQQSALAGRQSIMLNELKTVIAIPLRARHAATHLAAATPEGVLYLDSHAVSTNLTGVSHDVLRALAGECAALLESARLLETERAAQQYRQELEIAAAIQHSLIPEAEVQCDYARVNGRCLPCKEVGGDFFDVHISSDAVTVMVADVSGKGVSAALLASVIHGMFYAQLCSGADLVETVVSVNRFLCSRVAGRKYATLLVAQLGRSGVLRIVNCGHVPAIVADQGVATQVSDSDLPVGLLPEATFHMIKHPFSVGARLCLLTDGITESVDPGDTEFGLRPVEQHLTAADPVEAILAANQAFCHEREAQDDRTLLVLERTG